MTVHEWIIDLQYSFLTRKYVLDFKINVDHLFNCFWCYSALGYYYVIHSICVSVDFLYICIGFQSKKTNIKGHQRSNSGQGSHQSRTASWSQWCNSRLHLTSLSKVIDKKLFLTLTLTFNHMTVLYENIPLLHTQLVPKYQMYRILALRVIVT